MGTTTTRQRPIHLRTLRLRRGLTQLELSKLTGIDQPSISKLERFALKYVSARLVFKLAAVLDVHPAALRFGPDPADPPPERRPRAGTFHPDA